MPSTPKGLPYPAATDPVAEGAAAIQALATAIDGPRVAKLQDLSLSSPGWLVFSDIPQTYLHLMIEIFCRADLANPTALAIMKINGVASNSYHSGYNDHGSMGQFAAQPFGVIANAVCGSTSPGWTSLTVTFPNYRASGGIGRAWHAQGFTLVDMSATGPRVQQAGGYIATPIASITGLELWPNGGNWLAGTRGTLYGLG